MAIDFDCVCGTAIEALDGQVGRKVMCPACRSDLTVPPRSAARDTFHAPVDLGIELRPAPPRPPAADGLALATLPLRILARLATSLSILIGATLVIAFITVIVKVVWTNDLRGFVRTQAQADALAREEWPTLRAKADEARARLDAGFPDMPRPAPDPGRRTAVDLGDGEVLTIAVRVGLPIDGDIPDPETGHRFLPGQAVVLADDTDPGGPDRDVILCGDLGSLHFSRSPQAPGRSDRLRALARDGRIFAVPRGTIATITDVAADKLAGGVVAYEVQIGEERGWVAGSYVR